MRILHANKQDEFANRIIANYLIGKDALNKAFTGEELKGSDYFDALEHLTENTVTLLAGVCGYERMLEYSKKYNLLLKNE